MKFLLRSILALAVICGVLGPIAGAAAYFLRADETHLYIEQRTKFASLTDDEQAALRTMLAGFPHLNATQRAQVLAVLAQYQHTPADKRGYVLEIAVNEQKTARQVNDLASSALPDFMNPEQLEKAKELVNDITGDNKNEQE